jgi:hypothetical protein
MKKTISGVLLALTAVFALVACGKKKTTKSGDDTTKETTKKDRKRKGIASQINFYCWNDEFKTRLNAYYGGEQKLSNPDDANSDKIGKNVKSVNGSVTILESGTKIQWTMYTNEGSVYQDNLDMALENDMVDMFVLEADYATKYVKSEFVIDMATQGLDTSKQYKYTVDVVTNAEGKVVGSSWQATPGAIVYNEAVADAVFEGATYAQMSEKLSTSKAKFDEVAAAVKAKSTDAAPLYTLIGPDCWFRTYENNLSAKMYDGSKITVDANVIQWIKDTKAYADAGYIQGVSDDYKLWGGKWASAMAEDKALCVFTCPWFTDFCLTGNRGKGKFEADDAAGYKKGDWKPAGMKIVAGYSSWFWGGTWLTATPVSQQESSITTDVKNIINDMTTNKATLLLISKGTLDFTNNVDAMTELAAVEAQIGNAGYSTFFGQNPYGIYAEAVKKADLSKASDFDQQISEKIQGAFRPYFAGKKTAAAAWDEFVKDVKAATSVQTIDKAAEIE